MEIIINAVHAGFEILQPWMLKNSFLPVANGKVRQLLRHFVHPISSWYSRRTLDQQGRKCLVQIKAARMRLKYTCHHTRKAPTVDNQRENPKWGAAFTED